MYLNWHNFVEGSDRESCSRDACSEIMKLHNFSLSSLSIKILLFSIYCFWDYILFLLFFCFFNSRNAAYYKLSAGQALKGKMEREKLSQCQLFITAFWFCFLLKKNSSLIQSVCVWLFIKNAIQGVLFHVFQVELPWI